LAIVADGQKRRRPRRNEEASKDPSSEKQATKLEQVGRPVTESIGFVAENTPKSGVIRSKRQRQDRRNATAWVDGPGKRDSRQQSRTWGSRIGRGKRSPARLITVSTNASTHGARPRSRRTLLWQPRYSQEYWGERTASETTRGQFLSMREGRCAWGELPEPREPWTWLGMK